MVSVVGSEPFLSLESKRGFLTVDEELDHYRQRFQSMKLVLKELQQQVVLYKTRCTGVNTVALMLKESKQEVMKLTKQKQSLEIAVANLQNRLSTNGLASSVNIEETELFVPGPSKQTLDNLVRENARLRSLLKNHEAQAGNKSLEELQKLKTSLQILEAENSQLKVQILEFENTKHVLSSQFEEVVTKLNKEHQDKILKLEQELNHRVPRKISSSQHHEICVDIQSQSRPTQTVDVEPSNIDEMRNILKLMCAQCLTLDMSLENVLVASESGREIRTRINDQAAVRTEENYLEMEKKLNQVIQMNQRWQSYNQNREQQVHGLLARIVELEQLNQEGENLKSMMQAKEVDNLNLRKEIDNLTKEKNKLWSKPQFDISIVEILKQQIQVCTEDFNTERKDRENAVIRSKQLQDEIQKLMNENTNLKKDMANMQEIKNTLENQTWTRPQPMQYFTSNKGLTHLHKIPFLSSSSSEQQHQQHLHYPQFLPQYHHLCRHHLQETSHHFILQVHQTAQLDSKVQLVLGGPDRILVT